jgi:hypothetical protein
VIEGYEDAVRDYGRQGQKEVGGVIEVPYGDARSKRREKELHARPAFFVIVEDDEVLPGLGVISWHGYSGSRSYDGASLEGWH